MELSLSTPTLLDVPLNDPALINPVLNDIERSSLLQEVTYSVAEAAIVLNLSEKTVRRYLEQGRLVGYRVGPKLIKIPWSSIMALLAPL